MTAIALRRAGAAESALLAALHAECFAGSGEPPWSAAAFAGLLATPGTAAWLSLAPGDAAPGGFVAMRSGGGSAEILSIGVLPGLRRRGHGRALLEAALDAAAGQGATEIFLEVAEDNQPAAAFYGAAGFAAVGRRRRYYRRPGGAVDAVVMRRALDGRAPGGGS